MKALAIVLLAFVAIAFAGYGDPSANPKVASDTAQLPTYQERALHAAWNFIRSDPGWWRNNILDFLDNRANGNDFLSGQDPVSMLPYERRLAGAAHYHANQMMVNSPDTCENTGYWFNATDCQPNAQTLGQICCFRQEDCNNCTRGPDYRIIDFGYQWNKTRTRGGGYGEGIAANTPPNRVAEAVAGIACSPPDLSQPNVCNEKDNDLVQRQALFGARDGNGNVVQFTGGGGGYAGGGKENHYWVFDAALGPSGDSDFVTARYPIASASYVGFNASFAGWLLNWDQQANNVGANPEDTIVVISGVGKKQLTRIGTGQNYWVLDLTGADSCVSFAFGARKGGQNYRYPESGNVLWGCTSGNYETDSNSCGACDPGICFKGTCYSMTASNPSSAATVTASLFAALAVALALLL